MVSFIWALVAAVASSLAVFFLGGFVFDGLASQKRILVGRSKIGRRGKFGEGRLSWRSTIPIVLVRGIPGSQLRAVRRLANLPATSRFSRSIECNLQKDGVVCTREAIWMCLLYATAIVWVLGSILSGSLVLGALFACVVAPLVASRVKAQSQRRLAQMRRQVPDALRALGTSLGSGRGVLRSFEYAASRTPAPLGPELMQVVYDIETGSGVDDALAGLQRRVDVAELGFVAVALEVQHESGGSMKQIIATAVAAIKESFDLERSLQVKTAQARLSARVVGVMPFVLLGMLVLVSPDYLQSLSGSAVGIGMLAVAAVLDLIGVLIIHSMMEVKL